MSGGLPVRWLGEELHLLPERALFWPRGGALFVADLHLGKEAVFRSRGIPIPEGSGPADLARLVSLVARLRPSQVVMLGDLIHGREGWTPELRCEWARVVEGSALRAAPTWTLVRGNHDLHGGPPPPEWGIREVDEGFPMGPFRLAHHPGDPPRRRGAPGPGRRTARVPESREDSPGGAGRLAGHLHPHIRLRGPGDRIRVPAFLMGPREAILPAFGSFTGGTTVVPGPGTRVFAVGPERVMEVSGSGPVPG